MYILYEIYLSSYVTKNFSKFDGGFTVYVVIVSDGDDFSKKLRILRCIVTLRQVPNHAKNRAITPVKMPLYE